MDIIVKQDFTAADAKKADVARAEFRKSSATSKASNVLEMADTQKTVLLCDDDAGKFATPAVLSKYGYRRMTRFPYALGNCDYCGSHSKCQVFSHLSVFDDVWKRQA